MASSLAGVARAALSRQAKQSAIAVGLAAPALLVLAPIVTLVAPAALSATQHLHVPFGEVSTLVVLILINLVLVDDMVSVSVGGRPRPWLLVWIVVVQLAAWAAIAAVAKLLGVQRLGAASIAFGALVHVLSRALAVFLKPLQRCDARLRRTVRELKMSPVRFSSFGAGMTEMLYVYMTVFTHLDPAPEVLVMGVGMPLLQAVLMAASSKLMLRQERKIAVELGSMNRHSSIARRRYSSTTEAGSLASKDKASLVMVLNAETLYSTGAFVSMALVESDEAFFLSLVAMLTIEVVQVVVHVKARRVVSRVVAEGSSAPPLRLCADSRLRQWLLHQELGEKVGVLMALGFLAVAKATDRGVPAVEALHTDQLVRRGLAMVLLGLFGDVCKDLASQAIGLVPSSDDLGHVSLTLPGAGVAVLVSLDAGLCAQIGLSLGAPR